MRVTVPTNYETADGLEGVEEGVLVQISRLLDELGETVHLDPQEERRDPLHFPKLSLSRQVPEQTYKQLRKKVKRTPYIGVVADPPWILIFFREQGSIRTNFQVNVSIFSGKKVNIPVPVSTYHLTNSGVIFTAIIIGKIQIRIRFFKIQFAGDPDQVKNGPDSQPWVGRYLKIKPIL